MNPSYNSREKHLPELTYLWRAGKELNHTTIDTYSGAQVTFPKSDLSLVKNPTSFLVKEKSHFINTTLCASVEPIFIILKKNHISSTQLSASVEPIILKKKNASAEPIIIILKKKNLTSLSNHHHHQPFLKTHLSKTLT